jgi:hypothetical protein
MTHEEFLARLGEVPEAVQNHVFGEDIGDLNRSVIDRNALTETQVDAMFDLLNALILKAMPADRLEAEVGARLLVAPDKARKIALDIAGYRLLPLDKYLGDIDGLIRLMGGDPAAYPPNRVRIEERTSEEAAEEVAKASAQSFDYRMRERLKDIADSFFRGVRTEKQVMDVLLKPVKTGGLELAPDAAARIVEELKEEQRAVHIREQTEKEKATKAAEAAAAAAPEEPPKPPTADFSTIRPEDEKEIADLKANIMPAKGATDAAETARKIATTVEALYAASGLQPADEDLQKRLKTIIGNRLRDIRDSMETLEMLVQPKELGGMSLSQDDARKLLSLIEGSLKAVHAAHAEEVRTAKSGWLQAEAEKKSADETAGKANEAAELDTLFGQLAAKSKKLQNQPLPPLSAVPASATAPQIATTAQSPKGVPPVNLPVIGSPPEPAPARPVPTALPPRPASPPPPAPMAPPPATIVRPAQVPPPPLMPSKPMMQDIVPAAPRLTGPVEALRATTLVDLRRLSKDPKEACAKIKDKIDLLADESYTRKTEGIKGWMESEVYRTYIEMMGEALEGKPMPQVIQGRQAAKKPYLSPEEIQAIAGLSRELRY